MVAYAENDLLAFPLDELLRELREETGGSVHIPEFALVDARRILCGNAGAGGVRRRLIYPQGVLARPVRGAALR